MSDKDKAHEIHTGIPFVDGPLNKMDLNHDGKADVAQILVFAEKVQPHIKAFLDHGGLEAAEKLLAPLLKPEALAALQALKKIAAEAAQAAK